MKGPIIAYYISAHGYGHGVRSTDILRALAAARPDAGFVAVTDLPEAFLVNRLPGVPVSFRAGAFDVGMVQLDSIRVDVEATYRRVEALYAQRDTLMDREARFLEEEGIALVVADIPAMPLEAARRAGIPAIAVGNFSWNWIYEEFAERDERWLTLVDRIAAGYGCSDLLLRLPFCEEMAAFPRKEDIPLVASPGVARRDELARLTGAAAEKKWVLLSFTSLDWDERALARVEELEGYEFFTVHPLEWNRRNIHAVRREQVLFSDVLASVDVVVSKPGFGLLSECVVNRKPLVYADRTDFREYAVLVREMPRYLKCRHIPTERLYAGDLGGSLESIARQPEPAEELEAGGASVAARRIGAFLS